MKREHYIALFSKGKFGTLWVSQITAELSHHLITFACVVLLSNATNSLLLVSFLVAMTALTPILFSSFAGVIADRFDRRVVILASQVGRLICAVLMLAFFWSPPALLMIVFFSLISAQLFEPAVFAAIPAVTTRDTLFSGNALFTFTRYVMFLIGYVIAGPLLSTTSPAALFLVVCCLIIIAVYASWRLPALKDHLGLIQATFRQHMTDGLRNFRKNLKEGFVFVSKDKVLAFLFLQIAFIFAIQRGFITVAPGFSRDVFGLSSSGLSLFLILPLGLGAILGTYLVNAMKHLASFGRLMAAGIIANGIIFFLYTFISTSKHSMLLQHIHSITPHGDIIALSFLFGCSVPYIFVPALTYVHEHTPADIRGRLFGNFVLFMNAFALIPVLVIGTTSSLFSVPTLIAIFGGVIVFAGLLGLKFHHGKAFA